MPDGEDAVMDRIREAIQDVNYTNFNISEIYTFSTLL